MTPDDSSCNRTWKNLTAGQRLALGVAAVLQVFLLVIALVDIVRRPAEAIRGSKGMWAAIAFINFIGPIAYFALGRKTVPATT